MTTATTASPARWTVAANLRRWLVLDAVVTGANALIYLVAAPQVVQLMGSTPATVRGIGVFLLVFTGLIVAAAAVAERGTGTARLVAAGNVLWAATSLLVVALGTLELTGLGSAWGVAQAAVVTVFAALQLRASR